MSWLVLLAGACGFGLWPFITGESGMRAFCAAQQPRAVVATVCDNVSQRGYRMSGPDQSGHALIHDPQTFGRFLCGAQFAGEWLVAARYQRND